MIELVLVKGNWHANDPDNANEAIEVESKEHALQIIFEDTTSYRHYFAVGSEIFDSYDSANEHMMEILQDAAW